MASSMRLPDLGTAFLRTTGVVVHTTPVVLHLEQLAGGGTGSHLRRRILQQSHAGRRLRLLPRPSEVGVESRRCAMPGEERRGGGEGERARRWAAGRTRRTGSRC